MSSPPPISSLHPEPGPWQEIAEIIGDLSQRIWYAGWLNDVEYIVWGWVQHPEDAPAEAREALPRLQALADAGGHWVRWHDDRDDPLPVVPIRLDRWRTRYATWQTTPEATRHRAL